MNQKTDEPAIDFDHALATRLQATLATPSFTTPTIQELCQSVHHRRARRRTRRVGGIAILIAALGVTLFATRQDGSNQPDNLATLTVTPDNSRVNHAFDAAESQAGPEDLDGRIRVMAQVVRPEPIFHVDPATQRAWQIGWIETEQSVPIDIQQCSPDQRVRFQNVLYRNDDSLSL